MTKKIANTTELQTELRRILAYAQSELPSRTRIAQELHSLNSALLSYTGTSRTANAQRREKMGAVSLDSGTLADIQDLTDENNHTEALVRGAKALKLTKLAQKFEAIGKLVELEGNLPSSLKKYRDGLYDELMAAAKQKLSPEDYDEFYGCF